MRSLLLALLIGLPLLFTAVNSARADDKDSTTRDLFSDTWVANDALGRVMPSFEEVGPVKTDHRRVVGMFYITWHSDSLATLKSPYRADVSKVLAADPADLF